jgi:nitroreductase
MDAIRARRTVRAYRDEAIERETVGAIVEAGRLAPSSRNMQPWRFVVVTGVKDRAELAMVGRESGQGTAHVAVGPVTVALVGREAGNGEGERRLHFDLGQASMSMQVAASAVGLGTCPSVVVEHERASEVLGLDDGEVCLYLLTLGWPREPLNSDQVLDRRPVDEVCEWLSSR